MKLIEATKCSGCGACQAVCSRNAIEMKAAEDGFKYPQINPQLCSRCGRCLKICQARETEVRNYPAQAYAAVGRNEKLVSRSASGGVFSALANKCMSAGMAVSGAVMERDEGAFRVRHKLSGQREDLEAMQGSKYMQSDAWECYRDVMKAVRAGEQVLFSGTPCQVSAVRRLTGDPENLITVDLICHGVPSVQMFNDFAKIIGRRFGGKLCGIRFRDKSCGKSFYAEISIDRFGKCRAYYLSSNLLSFYRQFLSGLTYRESCYDCPYAKLERVSDLTIGDYWGIEKAHEADFKAGRMEKRSDWSCVLVNTEKGRQFLDSCKEELTLIPSQPEWAAEKNEQLKNPSKKPAEREKLMKSYISGGYAEVERKFVGQYGSSLKYYWRLLKNMRAANEARRRNKGKAE